MKTNDNGIDRDMTPEEIATYQTRQKSIKTELDAQTAEKTAALTSAKNKLASLGLNETEIAAILGA